MGGKHSVGKHVALASSTGGERSQVRVGNKVRIKCKAASVKCYIVLRMKQVLLTDLDYAGYGDLVKYPFMAAHCGTLPARDDMKIGNHHGNFSPMPCPYPFGVFLSAMGDSIGRQPREIAKGSETVSEDRHGRQPRESATKSTMGDSQGRHPREIAKGDSQGRQPRESATGVNHGRQPRETATRVRQGG
nr:hypothetical protein Iba_chr10aCG17530 [Ipomoea batatas]